MKLLTFTKYIVIPYLVYLKSLNATYRPKPSSNHIRPRPFSGQFCYESDALRSEKDEAENNKSNESDFRTRAYSETNDIKNTSCIEDEQGKRMYDSGRTNQNRLPHRNSNQEINNRTGSSSAMSKEFLSQFRYSNDNLETEVITNDERRRRFFQFDRHPKELIVHKKQIQDKKMSNVSSLHTRGYNNTFKDISAKKFGLFLDKRIVIFKKKIDKFNDCNKFLLIDNLFFKMKAFVDFDVLEFNYHFDFMINDIRDNLAYQHFSDLDVEKLLNEFIIELTASILEIVYLYSKGNSFQYSQVKITAELNDKGDVLRYNFHFISTPNIRGTKLFDKFYINSNKENVRIINEKLAEKRKEIERNMLRHKGLFRNTAFNSNRGATAVFLEKNIEKRTKECEAQLRMEFNVSAEDHGFEVIKDEAKKVIEKQYSENKDINKVLFLIDLRRDYVFDDNITSANIEVQVDNEENLKLAWGKELECVENVDDIKESDYEINQKLAWGKEITKDNKFIDESGHNADIIQPVNKEVTEAKRDEEKTKEDGDTDNNLNTDDKLVDIKCNEDVKETYNEGHNKSVADNKLTDIKDKNVKVEKNSLANFSLNADGDMGTCADNEENDNNTGIKFCMFKEGEASELLKNNLEERKEFNHFKHKYDAAESIDENNQNSSSSEKCNSAEVKEYIENLKKKTTINDEIEDMCTSISDIKYENLTASVTIKTDHKLIYMDEENPLENKKMDQKQTLMHGEGAECVSPVNFSNSEADLSDRESESDESTSTGENQTNREYSETDRTLDNSPFSECSNEDLIFYQEVNMMNNKSNLEPVELKTKENLPKTQINILENEEMASNNDHVNLEEYCGENTENAISLTNTKQLEGCNAIKISRTKLNGNSLIPIRKPVRSNHTTEINIIKPSPMFNNTVLISEKRKSMNDNIDESTIDNTKSLSAMGRSYTDSELKRLINPDGKQHHKFSSTLSNSSANVSVPVNGLKNNNRRSRDNNLQRVHVNATVHTHDCDLIKKEANEDRSHRPRFRKTETQDLPTYTKQIKHCHCLKEGGKSILSPKEVRSRQLQYSTELNNLIRNNKTVTKERKRSASANTDSRIGEEEKAIASLGINKSVNTSNSQFNSEYKPRQVTEKQRDELRKLKHVQQKKLEATELEKLTQDNTDSKTSKPTFSKKASDRNRFTSASRNIRPRKTSTTRSTNENIPLKHEERVRAQSEGECDMPVETFLNQLPHRYSTDMTSKLFTGSPSSIYNDITMNLMNRRKRNDSTTSNYTTDDPSSMPNSRSNLTTTRKSFFKPRGREPVRRFADSQRNTLNQRNFNRKATEDKNTFDPQIMNGKSPIKQDEKVHPVRKERKRWVLPKNYEMQQNPGFPEIHKSTNTFLYDTMLDNEVEKINSTRDQEFGDESQQLSEDEILRRLSSPSTFYKMHNRNIEIQNKMASFRTNSSGYESTHFDHEDVFKDKKRYSDPLPKSSVTNSYEYILHGDAHKNTTLQESNQGRIFIPLNHQNENHNYNRESSNNISRSRALLPYQYKQRKLWEKPVYINLAIQIPGPETLAEEDEGEEEDENNSSGVEVHGPVEDKVKWSSIISNTTPFPFVPSSKSDDMSKRMVKSETDNSQLF